MFTFGESNNKLKLNTMKMQTEVIVSEMDKITGSDKWISTIEGMKSWELTDEEIEMIINGETVTRYSPNGRRIIFIDKKTND